MFCKKCNKELDENAKFCRICGTPVAWEQPYTSEQTSAFENGTVKEVIETNLSWKQVASVICTIVAAVIVWSIFSPSPVRSVKSCTVSSMSDSEYDNLGAAIDANMKDTKWKSEKYDDTVYVYLKGTDTYTGNEYKVTFRESGDYWTVDNWEINGDSLYYLTDGYFNTQETSELFFYYSFYGGEAFEAHVEELLAKDFLRSIIFG